MTILSTLMSGFRDIFRQKYVLGGDIQIALSRQLLSSQKKKKKSKP